MLRMHTHSPNKVRGLYQVRAALEGLAVTLLTASQKRDAAMALLRKAVSKLDDPHPDLSAHIDALAFYLLR
jgi:DNA-binding GntR family transcriptional regulator